MIHKLVKIKNVGQYSVATAPFPDWNGVFEKTNIIYGENRSGKTTFSLIFKSLSGDDELIQRKKSFNANSDIEVLLIDSSSTPIEYKNSRWNTHHPQIKIFDIHYIEENLYTGYISTKDNQENLFEIVLGAQGADLKNKINLLKEELTQPIKELRRLRGIVQRLRREGKTAAVNELEPERAQLRNNIARFREQIKNLNIELGLYSKGIFETHAVKINYYLGLFAPGIQLEKFSKNTPNHHVSFILRVNETRVHFGQKKSGYSAKYVLSEGDRNAIAFSFFLAHLDNDTDLKNGIVVFDDPISSFDYSRKSLTINHLNRLSRRVDQMFILTHDLVFARDCLKKIDKKTLQLKIIRHGQTYTFVGIDILRETLTGVFKDLLIIEEYLEKGAANETGKRDVIRCIRPVLEGFLRLKYFRQIGPTEWLGDILKRIRGCDPSDPLARLRSHIEDLEDLNDFSKEAHHSNPTYLDTTINEAELQTMINRLVEILGHI